MEQINNFQYFTWRYHKLNQNNANIQNMNNINIVELMCFGVCASSRINVNRNFLHMKM